MNFILFLDKAKMLQRKKTGGKEKSGSNENGSEFFLSYLMITFYHKQYKFVNRTFI